MRSRNGSSGGAFRGSKPVVHKRPFRIVVGHVGTGAQRVGFGEGEVAHVADVLAAKVAPEFRVAGNVAVESIAVLASRQSAIKQAVNAADALVAPVDVFIAVVMLRQA